MIYASESEQNHPSHAYAIMSPEGNIIARTVSLKREGSWSLLWCRMPYEFTDRYWNRPEACRSAWRRLGYSCVPVEVTMRLK